jgi:hypothetical protein
MGKGALTKQKAPAGRLSHAALNRRFRAAGGALRGRLTGKTTQLLPNPPGHISDFFLRIRADKTGELLTVKGFGSYFRKLMDEHDELVSTSSMRELIAGVIDKSGSKPLTAGEEGEINEILNSLSRVRQPTRYVGFALSPHNRMQHPTRAGAGYFADAAQTMSAHNALDRERKQAVLEEMEAEIGKAGATAASIAKAGARRAISFTLNEMQAPITAADIKPHALKGGAAQTDLAAQLHAREDMKDALAALGGTVEPGLPDPARGWAQRMGKGLRSASPLRR